MGDLQPATHAALDPSRPAVIMAGSGTVVTYGEMESNSRRFARVLREAGVGRGGHVAILMENHPRCFEVYWAAQRIGAYTTPINWHLKAEEAGYIVSDCGASVLVTSAHLAPLAAELAPHLGGTTLRLMVDGVADGFDSYEAAISGISDDPLGDEVEGSFMFYSSGTTGRPKGIKPRLAFPEFGDTNSTLAMLMQFMYGFDGGSRYLSPAPLYHAAPIGWSTSAQRLGATVVVMERFDPEATLEAIERHAITHAQFVPTHFVRMLKLDESVRSRHDVSSLRTVVHAAAPCPVDVKHEMIRWWGPIVHEYYAGSEGNGFCAIGPEQWLAHPGSVGLPVRGTLHICDEDGDEVPAGQTGQIWFESDVVFEYHNDPDKTRAAFNDRGWSSLGDIGHVDADGYLYLTDRASHMIISGGVNIYPQEVENLLVSHPKIADVAVIGVPNDDLGEEVKAVVICADGAEAGPELAAEIIAHCRSRLAHYKCPVSVDFVDELPRLPTGKLLKRELRQRYWPD
jgi:acyl-CoA synthetase (AMP-forming)/AMP-acid ligase II